MWQGIKGILNGVEDIIRPDNKDLGLEVSLGMPHTRMRTCTCTHACMMSIVTRTTLDCHHLQVTYDADSLEKKKVIKLAMQEALNMTVRHTRVLPRCLRARMRTCVHGLG